MAFGAGQVVIPTLAPGKPVDLTIQLDHKMPAGKFDVSLLRSPAVALADATVEVTGQTIDTVTLRVTAKHGLVGAGVIYVLCTKGTSP